MRKLIYFLALVGVIVASINESPYGLALCAILLFDARMEEIIETLTDK